MTSTLTDRYVHATLRGVPEDRRADLGEELRSTITDMVDGRVDAGADPEEAERATLTELGDPGILAASYTGASLQLLGPRFYLVWKCLTLRLLTWVPALVAVVVAGTRVLQGGDAGSVVGDAVVAGLMTAMHVVFWTTLVFALVDRAATDEPVAWSPDNLPEVPVERDPSVGDAGASIAFNLLVAAALVVQHFRSWVAGPDGDDVPILDPDLWSGWLPFLLVVIVAVIGLELWRLRNGWSVGALVATVATSVAFSAPVAWLALEDRLLNPAFVDAVGLGASGQDNLDKAIAAGAVLVALWEVVDAALKTVASRRET